MIKTSINVDYTSFLQLQFTNFTSVLKPLRCIYILLGILGAFSWQFLCFYCTFTVFRSSPRVSSSSSSSCFQQTSSDKTSHMPPVPSFPSRFCITAVHEIVTAYKSTAFRCMEVNLKLFSTSASPPSFISFPSPGTTILLNSQFLPVYDIFTLLVIITCFFSLLHCHAWFSSVSDRQRSGGEDGFKQISDGDRVVAATRAHGGDQRRFKRFGAAADGLWITICLHAVSGELMASCHWKSLKLCVIKV